MLGHSAMDHESRYALQTLKDNVSLFTPEVLDRVNQIVVRYGHEVIGKKVDEELRASCDSFVVETDVHFPTDINLLFDAMRKTIVLIMALCDGLGLSGWRQGIHLLKKVKKHFRKAQQLKRSTSKDHQKKAKREQLIIAAHIAYLELAESLIARVKGTLFSVSSPSIVVHLRIKEIENSDEFREARRKHSAVESSINAIENHGLDRCRDHGQHGFKRYVGLAVLARNIQIIGHILQQKELSRLQRLENKLRNKLSAAL